MLYAVKLPIGGYDIQEAKSKMTHAVLTRNSLSDSWRIYAFFPNEEEAKKCIPIRAAWENELTFEERLRKDQGLEDWFARKYPYVHVCQVLGKVVPVKTTHSFGLKKI